MSTSHYRLTSSHGLPWLDLDQPMRLHWSARASAGTGMLGIASTAIEPSALGSALSLGLLTIPPALIYIRAGTTTLWQTIARFATAHRDRRSPPSAQTLLAAAQDITQVQHDGLNLLRTPSGYLVTALITAPFTTDVRDDAAAHWGRMLAWAGDTVPGIRLALTLTSGPTGRNLLDVPEGLQIAARAIAGRACDYRSYLTALIPSRTDQNAADTADSLLSQATAAGMTVHPLSAGELSRLMSAQTTGATRWPETVTPGKTHCTADDRHHAVARIATWPQRAVKINALDRLLRGDEEAIKTVTVFLSPYTAQASHTRHRRWAQVHDGYREERTARGQRSTVNEARSSKATDLDFDELADGACLVKTEAWVSVTHPDTGTLASARSTLNTASAAAGIGLDWQDGIHHRHLLATTPLGVRT